MSRAAYKSRLGKEEDKNLAYESVRTTGSQDENQVIFSIRSPNGRILRCIASDLLSKSLAETSENGLSNPE